MPTCRNAFAKSGKIIYLWMLTKTRKLIRYDYRGILQQADVLYR